MTRQFLRYTLVGSLSFAIDLLILAVATDVFGLHYLLSGVLGFLAGVVVNYFLSIGWVFHHRRLSNPTLEFVLFGLIGLIGLGLNQATLYVFAGRLGVHYATAKVVAGLVVLLWTFFARRLFLFSKNGRSKPDRQDARLYVSRNVTS